jgi:hypothetical protein
MTLRRVCALGTLILAAGAAPVEAQCTATVTPTMVSVPSNGSTSALSVITGQSCLWTAVSNVDWITVTFATGKGIGQVQYTVAPNTTTAARTFTTHDLDPTDSLALLPEAGAAIADLDGDGHAELLAGDRGGAIRVWTGLPAITPAPSPTTGGRDIWRLHTADVDADGDQDVVVVAGHESMADEVWWFENRGGQLAPD